MNQENALPRMRGQLYYPIQPQARRGRVREKDRDPYDGLRPWSAITHGAGAVFALAGTLLLFARSIWMGLDGWHLVSFLIYGLSMVGLYTASTLYHCLNTSIRGRIRLRKYDHASIYFLIAGTYTPMCLVVLRQQGAWGWSLFGAVWGLALAGLILTLAWITAPRWLTAGIYIFMGWMGAAARKVWRATVHLTDWQSWTRKTRNCWICSTKDWKTSKQTVLTMRSSQNIWANNQKNKKGNS